MISQINKYKAIKSVNNEFKYSISMLCELLDIKRSSYYKWLNRKPTKRDLENKELLKVIKTIHGNVNGIYGYRRLAMNATIIMGTPINHKRVYRLMIENNINCVIRRKRKQYRKSTPQHVSENILNRDFNAEKPNQKWLTDVTEFKYGTGSKAYLSAILDLYDNSIVGYTIGPSNNNNLVFRNLDIALESLNGETPMIHSDRGYQVRQEVA